MKSRVINTKHLIESSEGYLGYTSKLKPSLFYGNPDLEGVAWLQDRHTNKMSYWKLLKDEEIDGLRTWIYVPTEKFVKKFPNLKGKTFTVKFDLVQETRFAKKKRAQAGERKK